MYTQFFGTFLLDKNAASPQQLIAAIDRTASTPIKLRTLAMYHDLMNVREINDVVKALENESREFGELAVERHYLTEEQVSQLISKPYPNYLLLGQILVEDGVLTYADLEDLIIDYESEHEFYDLDLQVPQKEQVIRLIRHYFKISDTKNSGLFETYLILLFNNLIRFIGADFTPLAPVCCDTFQTHYAKAQQITGRYNILSAIDMDQDTAVTFASRYAMDTFAQFNEYVQASVSDFLNINNGLFTVNMSNNHSVDLHLTTPETKQRELIEFHASASYIFPVLYPFGTIQFIFSLQDKQF